MNKRAVAPALAAIVALCLTVVGYGRKSGEGAPRPGSPYLFVWSGDAAHTASDFLAVIDANPDSPSYARIVQTLPVEAKGMMPHHTEYEFPAGNVLFANGWAGRRSFVFDLSQPLHPRLIGHFEGRAGYSFLHSFSRLPNGNVLATFQSHGEGYAPGGGLVELKEDGSVVRSTSAVDPGVDKDLIWPYSLVVAPEADRIVSSSTVMGWPDWKELPAGSWPLEKINTKDTSQVQLWRLSDLRLLKTVTLPKDSGHHDENPAEPRLLSDGSVYVNTFRCGLFLMKGISGAQPSAERVYSFPGGTGMDSLCAVPVVIGHYWIQTVGALPGLIALDVSHPEKPIEVSRLTFDKQFAMPHWLAADRKGDRVVVTGDEGSWVLVARFDAEKGKLTLDQTFREAGSAVPGINFDREQWPHGKTGRAIVHGALFGPN
jgi:hypothetical protein